MLAKKTRLIVLVLGALLVAMGVALGFATSLSVQAGTTALAVTSPRIGPEFPVFAGDGYDQFNPAVAYNADHHEYLVVWHNSRPSGRDIYAQRVSHLGKLIGSSFCITHEANKDRANPAVVHNPHDDSYLIVWMHFNTYNSRWEIWGRFIPWNGPGGNPEFMIASDGNANLWSPAVAWSTSYFNQYVVVWGVVDAVSGNPLGIGRRCVDATGFCGNVGYVSSGGMPHQPDIVFNPNAGQYLVAWTRNSGGTYLDIYGRFMYPDGTFVDPEFPIYIENSAQQKPAVTSNGTGGYLIVFEDNRGGDWDVRGCRINTFGGSAGNESHIAISTEDETNPDVATNADGAMPHLVTWQRSTASGESIRATRVSASGAYGYSEEIAPAGLGDNEAPAIGGDILGFLIVYEWESASPSADRDVYGRMWWSDNAVFLPVVMRQFP